MNFKNIRAEACIIAQEHRRNESRAKRYHTELTTDGTIRVPAQLLVDLIDNYKSLKEAFDVECAAVLQESPRYDVESLDNECKRLIEKASSQAGKVEVRSNATSEEPEEGTNPGATVVCFERALKEYRRSLSLGAKQHMIESTFTNETSQYFLGEPGVLHHTHDKMVASICREIHYGRYTTLLRAKEYGNLDELTPEHYACIEYVHALVVDKRRLFFSKLINYLKNNIFTTLSKQSVMELAAVEGVSQ
jgi:hypothetical protein